MPTIFAFTRHSVENCAMANEKIKKMLFELFLKVASLREKHGIKVVGSWSLEPEHLWISVFEVPTVDAFLKYLMEPEVVEYQQVALQTIEIKVATSMEEFVKLLK